MSSCSPDVPTTSTTTASPRSCPSSSRRDGRSCCRRRTSADSSGTGRMPSLATASRDLKDLQRPWAVKAILGSVPRGSRLLEIGAGEPVVAELLARLGYDVTVVDPYDGRDRGPADVDAIRAAAPHVRVIQGVFPGDLPDNESFDCIYSISVLEHLPTQTLD